MMTFATPFVWWSALVCGGIVTALHFLSVRRPPLLVLPTTRFLADGDARAVSRTTKPSDVLLLLLRVIALLTAGAALAGPRWDRRDANGVRFIVADRSWQADSVALLARVGGSASTSGERASADYIVWSDTISPDGGLGGMRADMASSFPLALRAVAQPLRAMRDADSVTLVIVAPPGGTATFDAWNAWRRAWPGTVQVVDFTPTGSRPRAATPVVLETDAIDADDAVAAAYTLLGVRATAARQAHDTSARFVLMLRTGRRTDSTRTAGAVTVLWPEDGVPVGWQPVNDSVGAVAARGVTLLSPMVRRARATATVLRNARPIAWWSDGEVAALERPHGVGCVREVGIDARTGDLLLNESARGLLDAFIAPCGEQRWPVPLTVLTVQAARQPRATAAQLRAGTARDATSNPVWLAPLLLAVAIALLVAEIVVRRRAIDAGTSFATRARA